MNMSGITGKVRGILSDISENIRFSRNICEIE